MTLDEYKELLIQNFEILPGQKLCRRCFNKLFNVTQKLHENTPADQETIQVEDEPSIESARHIANQSKLLGQIELFLLERARLMILQQSSTRQLQLHLMSHLLLFLSIKTVSIVKRCLLVIEIRQW